MSRVRSLLWIGESREFPGAVATLAPALDVVWEPDIGRALARPLECYDAVLIDAHSVARARASLKALGAFTALPTLVRLPPGSRTGAGPFDPDTAARVWLRTAGAAPEEEVRTLLTHLESLARCAPPSIDATAGIVFRSARMRHAMDALRRAARTHATVLVLGETGTGKELVARALHRAGPRRDGAFVAVNCAAVPEGLLESELFGHVRGAFTGADRDRVGVFEEADGGTLLLDEIGEMPASFQAKLLRALQERVVRPVGGGRSRPVDVRVVAATHRDLAREVAAGRFRRDLFYRLAVVEIALPPLRVRPDDLEPLALHLLTKHGATERVITAEAMRALELHAWPGNVRELENEIERALALARPDEPLTAAHFSSRLRGPSGPIDAPEIAPIAGESLRESLARVEAWLVRRALEANGGRRAETARRLGLTREGLWKKMKRLGIE